MEKEKQPAKEVGKKNGLIILSASGLIILSGFLWFTIATENEDSGFDIVVKGNVNRVNEYTDVVINENVNAATNNNSNETVNSNANSSTNTNVAVDDDTNIETNTNASILTAEDMNDWEIYENKQLGFSFKYPSKFGGFNDGIGDGDTGKAFSGSFIMGEYQLDFGGASFDYYRFNEEADFLHTSGYTQVNSDYFMLLSKPSWPEDPPDQLKQVALLDTIQAVNTEGILVEASFADGKETGAIFNLDNKQITGIAFRNRSLSTIPLEEFKAILATFEIIEIEEPVAFHGIDTSGWKTYKKKPIGNEPYQFTIKYPDDWEEVEYQDETVGFKPKCCIFGYGPESDIYEVIYPVQIFYAGEGPLQDIVDASGSGVYYPYQLKESIGYGNYEDYDDIEQIYASVSDDQTVFIQGQYYAYTDDEVFDLTKDDFRNIYLTMLGTFEVTDGI
ncbi:hypothetical protein KJ733_00100 [Patescibacteria group bacterium]|nr:hypothetical protein [Patescibacteria group bacterium]